MAYSVQAIDSIGAPVRIKLRTRISLKFHCNRRPLESCRRQTTNQNGPRRSGASDCSRWACVRDVARGRRPQISHAAHRVGAPTGCSGIRSRDRARGTSFAGASAPRWPLLRASWSSEATGRILIADYSAQSRRISVVRRGDSSFRAGEGKRAESRPLVFEAGAQDLRATPLSQLVDDRWL